MEKSGFQQVLDKIERRIKQVEKQIATVRSFYDAGNVDAAYEQARKLDEAVIKTWLLTNVLPAYTGNPHACQDVEAVMAENIPVGIGFTEEGWFSLRIPALLPKKAGGSADHIRAYLYPAMRDFFQGKQPVRYSDCVLVYRHVYSRDRPERKKRDHDNIEINRVSDIVAMYVMPDDNPDVCSHHYCSAEGAEDRTEVYVVPKGDMHLRILLEKNMPDKGVKLYETQLP